MRFRISPGSRRRGDLSWLAAELAVLSVIFLPIVAEYGLHGFALHRCRHMSVLNASIVNKVACELMLKGNRKVFNTLAIAPGPTDLIKVSERATHRAVVGI